MRAIVVVLLGLALVASQVAHGGAFIPFFMVPSLALVGLALLASVVTPSPRSAPPLPQIVAAGVFGGYVLWRCAVAEDAKLARIDAGQWLLYIGAWLAVVSALAGRRSLIWLAAILIAAILIESAFAALQIANPDESTLPYWFSERLQTFYFGRFGNRIRGLFLNPNQLAWAANVGALLTLGIGVWGRPGMIWRLVLIYFSAVFSIISLLTASRGGMLSLVAGFFGFCVLSIAILACSTVRRRGAFIAAIGAPDRHHRSSFSGSVFQ